ncbi:AraC family transcriptional regulator [Gordoniibacillus kamchatkensis]|uniref:AraC family transcriptional regulator n=1 Tax=Gordoniibacillus kamchatkensis TaxID=1590651 RepID=UPI0009E568FF|nr:AraC family transcriptional regulator [Paenibacillus sp. VKM B-2647]
MSELEHNPHLRQNVPERAAAALSEAAPRPDTYFVVSSPEPAAAGGIAVLFAGHSQTKPGHRLGPKVVDYYLLHHVLAGRGEFAVRGETHSLGAGDSFLIGPGELVRYESDSDDPWMYRWVAFRGDGAAALLQSAGLTPDSPVARTGGSLRPGRCIRAIERAFQRRTPGAALEACGHLLLLCAAYRDILAAEAPHGGGPAAPVQVEATVRQAIQYLSTQFAEPVSIELMAQTLGYNRAYLSKLFKRQTGVSPVTFLLRLRLDNARRLLRERLDLTTGQIAASVGFQDPLHFSKQFHRRYGQSPSEYRAAVRKFHVSGEVPEDGPQ